MGRNDIRLDQINARLGDLNKPRQFDSYNEDQAEISDGDGGGDGNAPSNAFFMISIVTLFLAVSGGTYLFSTGTNPFKNVASSTLPWASKFVSVVDASCGAGWREGYPNDKQLKCYLTQNVKRLCNPEEKKRLVAVLSRYRDDKSSYVASVGVSMLSVIGKAQTEGLAMGMAAAKMERDLGDPSISVDQKFSQLHNVVGMGKDIIEAPQRLIDNRGDYVPPQELVNSIRDIMRAGIMSTSDFGWFPDDLVYVAAKNAVVKGKACG